MLKASKTRCCRSWTCRMKPPTHRPIVSNPWCRPYAVSFPRIAMHIPSCRSPIQTSTASYRLAVKQRGWKGHLPCILTYLNRTRVMVSPHVAPCPPMSPLPLHRPPFGASLQGTPSPPARSLARSCVWLRCRRWRWPRLSSPHSTLFVDKPWGANSLRWNGLYYIDLTVCLRQMVVFMTLYSFRRIQVSQPIHNEPPAFDIASKTLDKKGCTLVGSFTNSSYQLTKLCHTDLATLPPRHMLPRKTGFVSKGG